MQALGAGSRDDKRGELARHTLLADCSSLQVRRIARVCDRVEALPGQILVREGWVNHWLFLICAGTAEVLRRGRSVGFLCPGQHCGELTLLGPGSEPATVRARTRMSLYVINRRYFAVLVQDIPRLRRALVTSRVGAAHGMHGRLAVDADELEVIYRIRGAVPRPGLGAALSLDHVSRTAHGPAPFGPPAIPVPGRSPAPGRVPRVVLACGALAAAAAIGLWYHPPVVVLAPGPVFDVAHDVTITGVQTHRPSGRYLMTSVRTARPTALGAALAVLQPGREVRALPRANPAPWTQDQRTQFVESRLMAAAAAARAEGLPVTIDGSGAVVTGRLAGLRAGDVVVGADGRLVRTAPEVGTPVGRATLIVERDGGRVMVSVPAQALRRLPPLLRTRDLRIQLPFRVRFRHRDVVGPSAGLVYALAVTDLLDRADLAAGRDIAATGTIDPAGTVGEVSGIREKALDARHAGADLLLVPRVQRGAPGVHAPDVRGVASLGEAMDVLRARS